MKRKTAHWLLDNVRHMAHCSATKNTCSWPSMPGFLSRIYLWLSVNFSGNILNSPCLSYSHKRWEEYLCAGFVHVKWNDTRKLPSTVLGIIHSKHSVITNCNSCYTYMCIALDIYFKLVNIKLPHKAVAIITFSFLLRNKVVRDFTWDELFT